MQTFRNLPVARKFVVAFGVVCVLCLALGGIALAGMEKIESSSANLADIALPSAQALADMQSAMQVYRRADMGILLCDTPRCTADYTDRREKAVAKFRDAQERFVAIGIRGPERSIEESANHQFMQYQQLSDGTVAILQQGNHPLAAAQTVGDNAQLYRKTEAAMNGAVAANTDSSRELCRQAASTYTSVRLLVVLVIGLTVVLSGVIGSLLTRSIAPPLMRAAGVLEAMAAGDLTKQLPAQGQDEIGRMAAALNAAIQSTRGLLASIHRGVETLSSAATELSARASQSAKDARCQSGEMSQIATATQEMAVTVNEVSQNAEQASTASRQAAQSATEGGAAIGKMAGSMQSISQLTSQTAERMASLAQRSEQIGQVVTTIRDISEQTNLLALNAAIEAQRAGEQGRGFAVVAGEVRRLAERTRSATEEISATIATIQAETHEMLRLIEAGRAGVASGLEDSEAAGRTLESTIESCRRSEAQVALIASASTEQATASQEISKSLGSISEVCHKFMATVDETTQASEQLSQLAAELNQQVNRFRLEETPETTTRLEISRSPNNAGRAEAMAWGRVR